MKRGQTFELAVSLPRPSLLPPHGRVGVRWALVEEKPEGKSVPGAASRPTRAPDAFGIYGAPTAAWKKVLHALDPDLYLVYRAPVAGLYALEIAPVVDEATAFEGPRWRESGTAPQAVSFPRQTPWPRGKSVPLAVTINPLDLSGSREAGTHVEQEPNDTPELAQDIPLPGGESGDGVQTVRISGGADDIEYFDNGKVGQSGDDWFKIVYAGREPRLLTCNLTIPDHTLAAQLRFYALDGPSEATVTPPTLLPLVEYTEGRNENERVHQQNEGHRAAINRLLKPGGVYFLRAEANAPGYEIELRLLKPAPYDDPRMAVRQAMYDHLGQVDSWLTNRPRGASVERRIRDTGNLMGTHCMSCHTQSGVCGPAVPIEAGYRVENLQNFRRLVNVMYESLRPTNYLKEAANNTSLAPLDIGDGPAGTRVAGHNVCTAERVVPARKLHSRQALRAANHVLQTADPSGINAAGPGSNVGQSVVYNYAGEILRTAWDRTAHPRYFAALEEKAEKMLAVQPRYSDDLSHRIEFFKRFFPQDYVSQNQKARAARQTLPPDPPEPPPASAEAADGKPKEPPPARFPAYQLLSGENAAKLRDRIEAQLVRDEARLRAIQNPDGSWGFDPGKGGGEEGGKAVWKTDGQSDPAPTALAVIALQALGHTPADPTVERGIKALLRMQDPYGRWNKSALTGFVTTAYAMHALSRLYPATPERRARASFEPVKGESLPGAIARVRALSHTDDPALADLMIQAVAHPSPWVRVWGAMALGGVHGERGVPALIRAMGDPVKMVRDAAAWAMEQTLLDDVGFEAIFAAFETGDDVTRESVLKALGMRADAVMTEARFDRPRLARLLGKALNNDPHPGVRAWAAKAAWQWWVWNPPLREPIQQAWARRLQSPEPNALAENCFRYQSHALFIANGHKANASEEHQYKELTLLFAALERRLENASLPAADKDRLARRLVGIAATYYNTSGGDGGPGQMGYVTPGSAEMIGKAALHLWGRAEPSRPEGALAEMRLLLEGSSGVAYQPLQDRVIEYSTRGPEELRTLAAAAVSDPSAVTLPATQEKVQPLVEQIYRGAQDYDRRQTLAQPVLRLFSRANWDVPKTVEQQELLYSLLIPKFSPEPGAAEMARILAAAADAVKPMGQLDADWYIADRMGGTLAANPDLHTAVLLRLMPGAVKNPLLGHFWLPSVGWVASYGDGIPEIDPASAGAAGALPAEVAAARARATELYLQMLGPESPVLSRGLAMRLANLTALRRNPAVQQAFRKMLETEKNEEWLRAARTALSSADARAWTEELKEAAAKEPLAVALKDGQGQPRLTELFLADFRYFSDYVAPELNRAQRNDEMSCMKCHAVPGRVPSMELAAPDSNGYWTAAKMLKNYLTLQQRVDINDIEQSKLLRKPLNVQTGKEDGHQGGRRYLPADRGYQIIRRWVLNQPRLTQSPTAPVGAR
ncbi:MAG TPA: HEAT repeat domain-containing protein [Blastocatellia bacterium]|nr:HEAT repeat domain-containing protein [Blastocatellia bacterium]